MAGIKLPTVKQKMLIKKIEDALKVKFKGVSCREASDFISANMDAFRAVPKADEPVTGRQQYLICKIEETLQVGFKGKTKREASAFISQYMEEYKSAKAFTENKGNEHKPVKDFDLGF